jgi:SOS response regulatory protein OraA/RecX
LQKKLREQQVAASVIADVLAEVLPSDRELELALRAGRQRWSRLQDDDRMANEARVYRFLVGRGFPALVARRAAREGRRPDAE